MLAALPASPGSGLPLAAGPAALRSSTSRRSVLSRAVSIPWTSKDLIRKHGRLFGTLGILCAGAAFEMAITNPSSLIGVAAAFVGLAGFLEGCILAFPRPKVAAEPTPLLAPFPPAGARR